MLAIVLFAQLSLLAIYLVAFDARPAAFHLYPIVWITVSAWVLWHARPPRASLQRHALAGGIAVGYLLVLGYIGGMFSLGGSSDALVAGVRLEGEAPPGYAPALFYVGPTVTVALVPYLVIGYLTLAYLVYLTVLDTIAASAAGALGLFGCIGCSWPILASLVAGAGGASGSVATAVYANAYPLATLAFVLAVALLYWRPSVDSLRQWRP